MRFCYNRSKLGDLTGLRDDLTENVFVRAMIKAGNDAEETC